MIKKWRRRLTVPRPYRMSQISTVMIAVSKRLRSEANLAADTISLQSPAQKRDCSKSSLRVLLSVNEKYQKGVDYQSYRLYHQLHREGDDIASETRMMSEEAAMYMMSRTFNRKGLIAVTSFWTELRQPWNSLRIHEEAAVGILW